MSIDCILSCPCIHDDIEDEEKDTIIVDLTIRFNDDEHHDKYADDSYDDLMDVLNSLLKKKKGKSESKEYFDEDKEWYINQTVELYDQIKVNKNSQEPDMVMFD